MRYLICLFFLSRIIIAAEPEKPPAPPPGWGDEPVKKPTPKPKPVETPPDNSVDRMPHVDVNIHDELSKHNPKDIGNGTLQITTDDHIEIWGATASSIFVMIELAGHSSGTENLRAVWKKRWREVQTGGEKGKDRYVSESDDAFETALLAKQVSVKSPFEPGKTMKVRQSVWIKGFYYSYRAELLEGEEDLIMEIKSNAPSAAFERLRKSLGPPTDSEEEKP